LASRRQKLDALMGRVRSDVIRYSEPFPDPFRLLAACAEHKLEGIVSKRVDRPYRSGPISSWIKVKCPEWRLANQWRHEFFLPALAPGRSVAELSARIRHSVSGSSALRSQRDLPALDLQLTDAQNDLLVRASPSASQVSVRSALRSIRSEPTHSPPRGGERAGTIGRETPFEGQSQHLQRHGRERSPWNTMR
jgi:hypothetical protein